MMSRASIRTRRYALRIGPVPLGLLGAAGFAALAAALWPVDVGAPALAPLSSGSLPPDLGRRAAEDNSAALDRPLFDPERRAWTARGSREDLTANERPPTRLTVRGILIEDRVQRALVSDGIGAPVWLVPGEGRDGWRLVSVAPDEVVVADAARHYTLAFLGPPVALRPVPRHPAPDAPALRPALRAPDAAPMPPGTRPPEPMSVRRIEITRPGLP